MIVPGNEYLLAVLNSKLGDFYIRKLGVTRNGGYFEYKPMFIEQLPVPEFNENDAIPREIKDLVAKRKYEDLDSRIYDIYGLSDEERDYLSKL